MLRRTYEQQCCSVAWALEVVGERWTLLIVRDALLGVTRFGAFHQRLGLAANVLTDRLTRLVHHGVVERVPYQERPTRYEYCLTPKGRELALVVLALMQWGDRYLAGDAGPPRKAYHHSCGTSLEVRLHCPHCADAVGPDEVVTAPQPRPADPPGAGSEPR